jgi:hypothetical protein
MTRIAMWNWTATAKKKKTKISMVTMMTKHSATT